MRDARVYVAMALCECAISVRSLWYSTWAFRRLNRYKHRGMVYLDGFWLYAASVHMRDVAWACRRLQFALREAAKSLWRSTWQIRHRRCA